MMLVAFVLCGFKSVGEVELINWLGNSELFEHICMHNMFFSLITDIMLSK